MNGARKFRIGRVLSWALAVVALAFVFTSVPLRDRCWDPSAPQTTRVAVSRDASGCVLHTKNGEVSIPASQCAQLKCEPGIASTFANAHPGLLFAVLALYVAGTLAWAARWKALLGFAGIDFSLREVWRLSLEAQAGGVLLPGGLGGDAFRIVMILNRRPKDEDGKPRSPAPIVVASVLLDRVVGLAVVTGVAAAFAFVFRGAGVGPLAYVLSAIPLGLLLGLCVLRAIPVRRLAALTKGRPGRIVAPVLDYMRDPRAPRAIAAAVLFGVVVAVVQFACVRGLVFAVGGVPRAEQWIPMGTAMAFVVGAIPALPGGWGTADAAYVYFFGLAGLPAGVALAVCLLFRLCWYFVAVVGAGMQLVRGRAITPRWSR